MSHNDKNQDTHPVDTDNTPPDGAEAVAQDIVDAVDYKDMWLRAQADYQNLQRETTLVRVHWAKMSEIQVLEEFIPVLENLKKAFAADSGNNAQQFENWKKGIAFIVKQFEDIMTLHGVEKIVTVGLQFDPTVHEAVGEESSDAFAEGTIIREVDGGYISGDTVLRAARVIVSK
ncbi:MAG: nucleotide exchange factor GrpE [Candidatus Magasanikbacteria bacterium CG10_big_fil_rev_8_21_14_0_10_47_10]|uniref:Protein GrpE n=1 Tax=Candidatus Magasanikbacteria bacterium CG10_big_fil_rev_8_21_14_0_10_47_10 TaxID=1974652 RepID=A0A2H0TQ98_9BACT|nr:MAG: nucleotide exchange factor GrpE [Candidatus Magasanikbacteria bacterium CG10_big_fil_rev_8_21_14_0_10_47_10]